MWTNRWLGLPHRPPHQAFAPFGPGFAPRGAQATGGLRRRRGAAHAGTPRRSRGPRPGPASARRARPPLGPGSSGTSVGSIQGPSRPAGVPKAALPPTRPPCPPGDPGGAAAPVVGKDPRGSPRRGTFWRRFPGDGGACPPRVRSGRPAHRPAPIDLGSGSRPFSPPPPPVAEPAHAASLRAPGAHPCGRTNRAPRAQRAEGLRGTTFVPGRRPMRRPGALGALTGAPGPAPAPDPMHGATFAAAPGGCHTPAIPLCTGTRALLLPACRRGYRTRPHASRPAGAVRPQVLTPSRLRRAQPAASTRLVTPSLRRMLFRWALTVFSLISRAWAISLLVEP
jgi:hypothetical protein